MSHCKSYANQDFKTADFWKHFPRHTKPSEKSTRNRNGPAFVKGSVPERPGYRIKTSAYDEALGTQNHANGRAIRCPSTLAMNSDGKRWVLAVSSNSMPLKSGPRRCILAGHHGEARQSTFSARATDCPNAISAHQNYYFWGPHTSMGEFASKGPQLDTSGRLNLTPLLTGDCRLYTIPQRGE